MQHVPGYAHLSAHGAALLLLTPAWSPSVGVSKPVHPDSERRPFRHVHSLFISSASGSMLAHGTFGTRVSTLVEENRGVKWRCACHFVRLCQTLLQSHSHGSPAVEVCERLLLHPLVFAKLMAEGWCLVGILLAFLFLRMRPTCIFFSVSCCLYY